jgi:hypothetical protein
LRRERVCIVGGHLRKAGVQGADEPGRLTESTNRFKPPSISPASIS